MSGVMERTLAILERLADAVDGLPLATLADELAMPRSAGRARKCGVTAFQSCIFAAGLIKTRPA